MLLTLEEIQESIDNNYFLGKYIDARCPYCEKKPLLWYIQRGNRAVKTHIVIMCEVCIAQERYDYFRRLNE